MSWGQFLCCLSVQLYTGGQRIAPGQRNSCLSVVCPWDRRDFFFSLQPTLEGLGIWDIDLKENPQGFVVALSVQDINHTNGWAVGSLGVTMTLFFIKKGSFCFLLYHGVKMQPHSKSQSTYLYVWIAYEVLWLFLFFFLPFFLLALVSVDLEDVWLGDSSNLLTSHGVGWDRRWRWNTVSISPFLSCQQL